MGKFSSRRERHIRYVTVFNGLIVISFFPTVALWATKIPSVSPTKKRIDADFRICVHPQKNKSMKVSKFIKLISLLLFVGMITSDTTVSSQSSRFREVKKSQLVKQAPVECLNAFRDFFNYVRKSSPDIVSDKVAQNRFLSKRMRETFIEHIKNSPPANENPDYPSNLIFTLVWNSPTAFSIIGSRHYDFRDRHNANDNRAIIDVIYEWDKENSIENQYANEKQLHSFIFIFEENQWKLDDIYTYDDEFTSTESLRNYFQENSKR